MRPSSMIFVLFLSSASLGAQTSTGNNPAILVWPPVAQACPVQFFVERRPQGAVVETKSASVHHGQGLDLGFGKPTQFAKPDPRIVAADIVVHGYPAMVRVVPARPSSRDEITEQFHLSASAGQPLLHSSVWTTHMVSVTWVELTRVEYSDGITWEPANLDRCIAAPSLYVLVDSAR